LNTVHKSLKFKNLVKKRKTINLELFSQPTTINNTDSTPPAQILFPFYCLLLDSAPITDSRKKKRCWIWVRIQHQIQILRLRKLRHHLFTIIDFWVFGSGFFLDLVFRFQCIFKLLNLWAEILWKPGDFYFSGKCIFVIYG